MIGPQLSKEYFMHRIASNVNPLLALSLTLAFGAGAVYSASAQNRPASTGSRSASRPGKNFYLYIGSFTGVAPNGHPDGGTPSKGIYVARFNSATGNLDHPQLAAEVNNPTFLAVSPNHRFLYAATETSPASYVSAYAISGTTGKLRLLNKLPTGGAGTAHIAMDRTGKFVMLANYGSGSVAVMRVKTDGSLGEITAFMQHSVGSGRGSASNPPPRPVSPHPHSLVMSPDNRFAIVPDLGMDKIFIYSFDVKTGRLSDFPPSSVALPPNDGPRHFVFAPNGKFGYLIAQDTGNVEVFIWDAAQGTLTPLQTVHTVPPGLDVQNMSAEIGITPNGKFLYESNRRTHSPNRTLGPDSIGIYAIDPEKGTLTEAGQFDRGTSIPRCFSIDPTGSYLLVGAQQNNHIDVLSINQENGELIDTGHPISIHSPACMQFVPAAR
jgi:6-phosphogluconolactonase